MDHREYNFVHDVYTFIFHFQHFLFIKLYCVFGISVFRIFFKNVNKMERMKKQRRKTKAGQMYGVPCLIPANQAKQRVIIFYTMFIVFYFTLNISKF